MKHLKKYNVDNIWYHITTIENWRKIQKIGYIDPKRTSDGMGTIVFKDKLSANDTILFPTWIIRDTSGYILLTIDCKRDTIDDDGKFTSDSLQARVNNKILLEQILKVESLPSIDAKRLEFLKRDDMFVGFVKVGYEFKYYKNKHYVLYCRWLDGKDHFNRIPKDFSDKLKKYVDDMVLSTNEYKDALNELLELGYVSYDEIYRSHIILPFG